MLKDESDFHASVFILGPNDTTVLIRNQRGDQRGLWKFPGGKKKRHSDFLGHRRDERPTETVIRETYEETGLKLRSRRLKHISTVWYRKKAGNEYNKHYFFYRIYSLRKLRSLSDEYEEAKIFQLTELDALREFHPDYLQFFLSHIKHNLTLLTAGR